MLFAPSPAEAAAAAGNTAPDTYEITESGITAAGIPAGGKPASFGNITAGGNSGILYLIVYILGFGLVNLVLAQNAINTYLDGIYRPG